MFGSQDDSLIRPVVDSTRQAPDAGSPAQGVHTVNGLGLWENWFGSNSRAGEPEGPQGEQDFALGVQPRMGGGAGVAQGKLIEVPDGTRKRRLAAWRYAR